MNRNLRGFVAVLACLACRVALAATDWSAQDYDLYTGDFNGDGRSDVLYVAKDPGKASGIAFSDGSGPNTPAQSWPSNYLGIPWYGNTYNVVIADFNGDGRSDLFLQKKTPGDHYLLLADERGLITGISSAIPNNYLGVTWSADQHRILAGDFDYDEGSTADLFLQPVNKGGISAIVLFYTGMHLGKTWNDGYLGFNWSAKEANVFAGDFNGDHYCDLLIQALPKFVMLDFDPPFPVPRHAPNMSGVIYNGFTADRVQAWSRSAFGADFSPLAANILVSDFNSDGRSDVLLQGRYSSRQSYLLNGNASGAAFSTAAALTLSVSWSADKYKLIAGNFDGGGGSSGIYFQALTPSGTNYYSNTITGSAVTLTTHNAAALTGVLPATAVGYTAGSFALSDFGQATYTIPIVVPRGVAGVQPTLSIAYGNSNENGLLGVGWDLDGLSAIERCKKTLAQDGSNDAVTLTATDRFCLEGQRLRLVAGTGYGSPGTQYQTEIEQYSRVTALGSSGGAPEYFVVEAKNGLKYEYGNTADSRIDNGTTPPRLWALNKVSDRSGNTMTVKYSEDGAGGSFRPQEVLYTSNSAAGLAAAYKVVFYYETRPAGDVLTTYVSGRLVRETQRLQRIETLFNDPAVGDFRLVRRYQLSYNTTGLSARSRLSAVQECDRNLSCLSPTTIGWQDGQIGLSAERSVPASGSLAPNALPIDINGDGISDMLFPSGTTWWFALANSNGSYSGAVNTGIAHNDKYSMALPMDYDANGKTDIVVPNASNQWQVLISTGSGFTVLNTAFAATASYGLAWVADLQGDGRQDLLYLQGNSLMAITNVEDGFNFPVTVFTATEQYVTHVFQTGQDTFRSPIQFLDVNGDGRTDLLVTLTRYNGDIEYPRVHLLVSNGNSYNDTDIVATYPDMPTFNQSAFTWRVIDLNGDGLSDIIYRCPNSATWCVRFGSASATLTAEVNTGVSLPASYVNAVEMDWDGDGRTDLLQAQSDFANWLLIRSTGDSFAPAINTFVNATGASRAMTADVNGDGLSDLIYPDDAGTWHYRSRNGVFPDLVSSITDGFANNVTLTYGPITDNSLYTKGANAVFPDMDVQSPMYVVKQYSATDGAGGAYTVSATYAGARSHLQGRGFEGFQKRTETDSRTGIRTTWTYLQSYPLIGATSTIVVNQPNNGPTISETTNQNGIVQLNTLQYQERYFPYVSQSTQKTYEVGGAANGQQIAQITTTNRYDDWGNQTLSTVSTKDIASGQIFETRKDVTYLTDTANWCISLMTRVNEQRTLPSGASLTRHTSFTPETDLQKCRVARQTVEPDTAEFAVATDLGYDAFGNLSSQTISASGVTTRTTTTSYGARGVFPVSATNAENETVTKTYDFALGVPLTSVDANNISTSWQYDNFGRKTREIRPDGTSTTWTYYSCNAANGFCGDSLLRYQVVEQQLDSSGSGVIRYDMHRFDAMGRALYEESQALTGAVSVVTTRYDGMGRVSRRSLPRFSQPGFVGPPPFYTTFSYDLVSRPILEQRQVSETDTSTQTTQYAYAGLVQTLTDPNGKVTTKQVNAIGQTVRVTDAGNGATLYEYDPFGNLTKTTDPLGGQISTTFDVRGFKVATSDPDMGNWSYTYYPTGELKTQTDAKSQTTTFTYDGVSRPRTRVEAEGTTTWTYGTSAAAKEVGKLRSVSAPGGYAESYTYDSLGRAQQVSTTIDAATYLVTNTYNSTTGFLETVAYPSSTSAVPDSRFKVKYEYAYGRLKRVRDANVAATIYWEQIASDAAGHATEIQLGNGLHTYSTYDVVSGFLTKRFTGTSTQIQSLSYQWDKVGNLLQRRDERANLTEQFVYDNLYRLDLSTLNGATNLDLSYDATGNITSKSDVGSYTYHATKKHAVVTAGTHNYGYDNNGNMTSRDGSAIAWTSFNLPSQIAQGSNTAQFFYAADRSRYKQISVTASGGSLPAGTETTLSIGGIFEKVTKPSGVVEYRHAIVAGKEVIALRTLRSSGANDTRYLIKDHLGSVDTVADEAGAVTMRLSFDAFGKRRNAASWSGTPSASDWTQIAATTHRGFTFHEMLDNVGLVHMSGRVYDPLIGRFLSADPNIPDASNSQMLNRYSYVDNNPLSYTDPSGFFLKKLFKKVKSFVKQWGGTIISIGFAMVGMPFVGALLSSAFNTAVNGGSVGSFLKNFAIGAAAGYVTGPIAGRLTSGLGLNASLVSTQVVRGGLGGGLSGGLSSTVSGGGFWEGFKGGAISGGVTAGVVGLYWQHTTEQFIKNNVTCTGGCSQSMLQTIREGGMSAVGQRLMSGFRSSGAMLTISPESSSPAGVGIGPHVITGTNDMYFDGNVQSRLGNLLAGEPWGPSLNDATTFVHELGHTVAGFNVQDPLNVSVSENLYRSWMGTPARSDYALLAQGQTSDPVPSRSIVDRIWRPW